MATQPKAQGKSRKRGSRKARGKLPELLFAQASPYSPAGTSLLEAAGLVTHETVAGFESDDEVVRAASAKLQESGFQVLQVSSTTINIAGPPQLFEEVFETRLETEERPVIKPGAREDTATFVECPDTALLGLIATKDTPMGDVLEGVAIEEPMYYHEYAFAPLRSYWHLRVPGDVSLGIGADRAHRRGVTGRGVKLTMVDSGWHRHPYFAQRGYRSSPVVLGPGATDPNDDESGHGTGESANTFAAAPDIDFTMVKVNFANSTGAFNAAVALRPDIISCSWGSSIQTGPLSAANQALAAAIAAAVDKGIVVVFSAGNGHWGFPGQHPDVISAGGVYVKEDGSMRASDYASGFASNVYPGRRVPDLSGLVGMQPGATYIMLPVQPGDEIDTGRAGGSHPPGDETGPKDGWAAFSGTSAAAPQIAGVCALVKEACPKLSPEAVKAILMRSAVDVTAGKNHGNFGHEAAPGFDLATGAGLVEAHRAVLLAKLRCLPHPLKPIPPDVGPVIKLPTQKSQARTAGAALSEEDVDILERLVLEGEEDLDV
jgi:subtilisin family serine protease